MEIHLRTVVVDCEDGRRAANFYSKLLGWPITMEDNGWVLLRDPNGGTGLSFETEENYVRPVWPEEPGKPDAPKTGDSSNIIVWVLAASFSCVMIPAAVTLKRKAR